MMEERKFYEVGHKIYYLNETEVQLLFDLDKANLIKYTPKEITVYGTEEASKHE